MKATSLCTLLLASALALPSSGQQKTYNWVQGNDETVRLDPGYFHTSPPYQPASGARSLHVDVDAKQPVTLAVLSAQAWNDASQQPETMGNLSLLCVQEHVVQTTYTCNVPLGTPMLLLVRDERGEGGRYAGRGEVTRGRDYDRQQQGPGGNNTNAQDSDRDRGRSALDRAITAGVEAAMGSRGGRSFFYPNDVHIQYYDWACTDNCNLPDPPRPKLFDWVPMEAENDRLDPGEFFHGSPWDFPAADITYHWDVQTRWPVTIAIVEAQDWYNAFAQPNGPNLNGIQYICIMQHVVRDTFQCHIDRVWRPTFFVVLDERSPLSQDQYKQAGFSATRQNAGAAPNIAQPVIQAAGQPAVLPVTQRDNHLANQPSSQNSAVVASAVAPAGAAVNNGLRPFLAANDIHIQPYRWKCVDACDQPDYGWQAQVDDKYYPSNALQVYGGVVLPDHDSEQVSIRVKSPVPMAVAMVRAKTAGRLYGQPDLFEPTIENSSCAQRGVQDSTLQCTFNLTDGAQSLVLMPEAGTEIPPRKKAEVNVQAWQCVNNCRGPGMAWAVVAREKFKPTKFLKMYSGIIADHDGQHVQIKIKSPVPMSAAVLPSRQAGQLYGKLDSFESQVKNSSCQQRNVQESTLLCSFDIADGPQSLVLLPEPGYNLPQNKKAEVEIQAVKCVGSCSP